MALEVKGVVEAFAAEGAEVALDVAVTLHVTVEQPLQTEALGTHVTLEARAVAQGLGLRLTLLCLRPRNRVRQLVVCQGVLDPVTTVDKLQRNVSRQPQLWRKDTLIILLSQVEQSIQRNQLAII